MTHVTTKGKLQSKRKEAARKENWDKALMAVRKLRKTAGESDAMVLVKDDFVIVQIPESKRRRALYTTVQSVKKAAGARPQAVTEVMASDLDYKKQLEAYNRQIRQHIENLRNDRERIVRTLRESPSPEALDFYRSID